MRYPASQYLTLANKGRLDIHSISKNSAKVDVKTVYLYPEVPEVALSSSDNSLAPP